MLAILIHQKITTAIKKNYLISSHVLLLLINHMQTETILYTFFFFHQLELNSYLFRMNVKLVFAREFISKRKINILRQTINLLMK